MNLGEKIYEFRMKMNLSQGDLADRLDVSRQSVSKWEMDQVIWYDHTVTNHQVDACAEEILNIIAHAADEK